MARSKSDIANSAIRIFLQEVGKFYDTERGLLPFGPKKAQKEELLEYFGHKCCFCGEQIDVKSLSQDHLIPMNKEHLGLHAWGNVVPCCRPCNNEKNHHSWRTFIKSKCAGQELKSKINLIESFV